MNKERIAREINKESLRHNLCSFTWQAYHSLPELKEPRILDLGCGTGIPTIEIAVLSRGLISAVDKDRAALETLRAKVRALDLKKHIFIKKQDFRHLKYKNEFFDIVWCEGAVAAIGFENGLRLWRRFLKQGGYMVIHDEIKAYQHKLGLIPESGYHLKEYFMISASIWMREYFQPLDRRITQLKQKYADDKNILELLEKEAYEVDRFRQNPEEFASIFYILKKSRSG